MAKTKVTATSARAKAQATSKVLKKTKKPAKSASEPASKPRSKIQAKSSATKDVVAELVDDHEEGADRGSEALTGVDPDKAYASPPTEDFDKDPLEDSKALALSDGSHAITSTDPLAMYLNEIRRYKVLSREEEQSLAKKYFESKDPAAAEALVKANLRFVVKVAADYSKFGAKMIDLIQEGNVGLMHAVREFNPYKGARLITYAVWWIRGYIQEFLMRQYSMVRIGTTQNQRKLFYQLQKEKDALDAMGIEPTASLIGSRLGIPENEVRDMAMRMSGRDVSLDRPLDDESGVSLGDLQKNLSELPLDDRLAHNEELSILHKTIEEIRPELSDREKIILDERILNDEPLTLQEIGEKHGITREAVRQMEVRVMRKIKAKMESHLGDGNDDLD